MALAAEFFWVIACETGAAISSMQVIKMHVPDHRERCMKSLRGKLFPSFETATTGAPSIPQDEVLPMPAADTRYASFIG
jgi:hypothetical protein